MNDETIKKDCNCESNSPATSSFFEVIPLLWSYGRAHEKGRGSDEHSGQNIHIQNG